MINVSKLYWRLRGLCLVHKNGMQRIPFDRARYPWTLVIEFPPPEFMRVAYICLYGGTIRYEYVGKSRKVLVAYLKRKASSLIQSNIEIIDPNGKVSSISFEI